MNLSCPLPTAFVALVRTILKSYAKKSGVLYPSEMDRVKRRRSRRDLAFGEYASASSQGKLLVYCDEGVKETTDLCVHGLKLLEQQINVT